jgi:hypothetical protein
MIVGEGVTNPRRGGSDSGPPPPIFASGQPGGRMVPPGFFLSRAPDVLDK